LRVSTHDPEEEEERLRRKEEEFLEKAEETGNFQAVGKFDSRNPASFYNGIIFVVGIVLSLIKYVFVYLVPFLYTP